MDALEFLKRSPKGTPQPIYVLVGDDEFLLQQVRQELVGFLLQDADPAYAVSVYESDRANWPTIRSELQTLPFLSPRRVVVVEQADSFVSNYRAELEKYLARPAPGTLLLIVKSWVSTTRLAKAVPDAATIACKTPKPAQLPNWCVQRAKSAYGKRLEDRAADLLVLCCEPSLGILDQELAKLATYVGEKANITVDDVDRLVGRSRAADTFKIFDAIGQGQPALAMQILQRLLAEGHEPIALLGAFSWQMRRLGLAWRRHQQGVRLGDALREVGLSDWQIPQAEAQMRRLGRRRLNHLLDWLVETDLGLKGNSPLPPTMQLERLLLRLIAAGPSASRTPTSS